jgi:aryl-alcohol dehydrogenase-like predicted oxidoreductase/GNAT superfamily N-acetyltransferase
MRLTIQLKENPTADDRQVIFDLLEDYNASQAGPEPERSLAVVITNDDGIIRGGLWALTYYKWMFVELMHVPEAARGQGFGTRMMRLAEAEALDRGCHGVWLDTFTFQARGFYEKLGYDVFAQIPEYPPGHSRLLLMKRLVADTMPSRQGEPSMSESAYRKLGNTGFDVSTVGFGTWQIGGGRWKADPANACVSLLRQALESGINIFDAAVVYGQYCDEHHYAQSRSQEILGQAFSDQRDRVYYCVKVGQFDEYSHRSQFDAQRLVDQVKQSMRRLRTDYLDICLIHAPTLNDVRRGVAIEVLRTLQALGMVRAVGYSFEAEPEHVRAALEQRVDVIMLQYNLIDRQCAVVLQEAHDHGVGILVGGPYKRGYLTGNFAQLDDLPLEDDYWAWNVKHNPRKVVETLERVQALMNRHQSVAAFRRQALRYVLDCPGVSSAIIGHRSIDEVRENLTYAGA